MKHTKIVATISDLRCDVAFLRELYEEGMNVVRMNTAHATPEGLSRIIDNTREASPHIGILMDTKGPEVRTTTLADGAKELVLKTGQEIVVKGDPEGLSSVEGVYVTYPNFVQDVHVGDDILFDDGEIDLKVTEKTADALVCKVLNDGILGNRKSVNVPGVRINLPSLTEKDRRNIELAIDKDIDFIAHSFVRNRQDVLDIQEILDRRGSSIKIIAKIENQEGVDNIDEIIEASYGVMIARGDLGIEVPQEKIPGIQRVLIRKCVLAHKPVIVATQMLHSMIKNPRPTRAEITDIANAIFYRTDALMLSGETASGRYPVEAVRTMAKVAEEAEKTKLSENDIRIEYRENAATITSYLSKAAAEAGETLGTKATLTDSYTGKTARNLAAYRGKNPVYAICYNEKMVRQLSLSYGVFPFYQAQTPTSREYLMLALKDLIGKGRIEPSDLIAYLSGSCGVGGGTTFLEINRAERILETDNAYSLI